MHDVFRLDDVTNDAQHMVLSHWLDIARREPDVPLSRVLSCSRAADAQDNCVILDVSGGSIREARVHKTGAAVVAALGVDPVGMTLERLMPPSYVADVIPAYAFCAGTFRPLSSLDEVAYSDGTRMLVRRLILPLERQPPGSAFAARYLMMIYDPAAGRAVGKAGSGTCRTMVATRSLSVAVFKDPAG